MTCVRGRLEFSVMIMVETLRKVSSEADRGTKEEKVDRSKMF